MPTESDYYYPGPIVTAIAFMSYIYLPDYIKAYSTRLGNTSIWNSAALIGAASPL